MIGIDGTLFHTFDASGKELTNSIGLYVKEIVSGFKELGVEDNFVLLSRYGLYEQMKYNFKDIKVIEDVHPVENIIRKVSKGKKSGVGIIDKTRLYRSMGIDYIWYPGTLYRNNRNMLYLTTILDYFFVKEKDYNRFSKALKNADALVSISTYTADETRRRFPDVTNNKTIHVIPTPIEDTFDYYSEPSIFRDGGVNRPYILCLNTMRDGKNQYTLLKAFNRIKESCGLDLVFCSYHFSESELEPLCNYMAENNLNDRVHFIQGLSIKERNWVLRNAKLFVTPAVKEGFGRTPVEAAMCDVPVISTKESALFETTMGMVYYYEDAFDDIELSNTIINVLNNYPSLEKRKIIANKFKEAYSPIAIASKYAKLFGLINS